MYATEELLSDSALFNAALVFPLEAAFRLDESIIKGAGAGQPLGILNAPATIQTAKQNGQASGTIVAPNITDMFGRMLPECRKNAVWLVGSEVEDQLYTLAAPSGGAAALIFTPGDDSAPYGRLMNRPVLPCEQCSNIGAVGDIIFADLSRYLIAQKPLSAVLSIHVRFAWGEGIFRTTYRVDGQPGLRTPITPYNGGPTKSAFATLQAR